jgi:glutamate synthase domain-containing protein 2
VTPQCAHRIAPASALNTAAGNSEYRDPSLTARLIVDKSAQQLARFLETSVELMQILARACGHTHLNELSIDDLVTWKDDMSRLSGVTYGGVGATR